MDKVKGFMEVVCDNEKILKLAEEYEHYCKVSFFQAAIKYFLSRANFSFLSLFQTTQNLFVQSHLQKLDEMKASLESASKKKDPKLLDDIMKGLTLNGKSELSSKSVVKFQIILKLQISRRTFKKSELKSKE